MPADVEKEARRELGRLERMPEAAAEYAMIRTYLDWLIELPWSVATEDSIDIGAARRILDEDHFGLEKVKKRILEFLAVRKLKPDGKSAILCLVGPPGVGKTSVGQSIARATSRKFVRISLGGVHDEAEIRGHRRTYIGALPGNIIQGIRKTGSRNPVFMLDEMDKLSASFHGDPASALLEVLDPEQNNTFRDSYLAVPFDLSQVMFIGTANVLDGIPGPLRDRCEVIEMTGYTEEEKIQIARRYLVKRRLAENGLSEELCVITDEALRDIVRHYTREAGCRNLEREIGAIYRHVATRLAEAIDAGAPPTARRLAAEAHEDPAVEALGQKPSEGERGKASEAALAGSAQHETVPAETRGSAADRGGDGGPADRDNGEAAGGVARGDDEGSEEGSDGKNRVGGNGNAAQGPGSDEVDGAAVRGKPGIPRIDLTRLPPGFDLPIRIDVKDLHGILGARKFESEVAMRTSLPGVATGLAWTPTGGDILFVEATRMPGKGNLILTGQLGDVMKESAQAAISLIKSRGSQFGVPSETFEKTDIHIHVPAGAIPKDGPSAGVTMYTALYSLLTGQTVRSDVAMTGEISLRGLVLPVGGIKDKVLAARGAEISTVCLPSRNKKDFEDIPASARETLRFVWLEKVEDAVRAAIGDAPIGDAPGGNAPPSPPRSMGS
jgi:ATP-dependent Lon protease